MSRIFLNLVTDVIGYNFLRYRIVANDCYHGVYYRRDGAEVGKSANRRQAKLMCNFNDGTIGTHAGYGLRDPRADVCCTD